ncbi:MAG: NADPH-dependent oxidoreductase [Spirochaetales bacterium]|nr:NADPH-dependent oxidoreductase [Spirochaetales bacterium]
MNQTITTIKNHRSIRQYKNKDIEPKDLNLILEAAHAMPTSIHGQQVSIVVVKDEDKRNKISDLAGGQPWIAAAPVFLVFVMDMNKTAQAGNKNNIPQIIHESAEGVLVSSFDAGIAMGAAIVAAESLGLGIVPIGGIRKNPQEMIDLLELPKNTFPIAGLVIGHPENLSAKKPRLSIESFAHSEKYNNELVTKAIDDFDKEMEIYYEKRGDKSSNWSAQIAGSYKQVYFPNVYPVLKSQGFILDK